MNVLPGSPNVVDLLRILRFDLVSQPLEIPFGQPGVIEPADLLINMVVFEVPGSKLSTVMKFLELLGNMVRKYASEHMSTMGIGKAHSVSHLTLLPLDNVILEASTLSHFGSQ